MKFKHALRRPKKPKKVTLERIREIVREEVERVAAPVMYEVSEEQCAELHRLFSSGPCEWKGGKVHMPITYQSASAKGPSGIRPVLPPPGVPMRCKDPNKTNLPDGFQSNTEEPE